MQVNDSKSSLHVLSSDYVLLLHLCNATLPKGTSTPKNGKQKYLS